MTSKEMTKQVFLSYAHRDQELATEIAKVLAERELRVWRDQQIEVGKEWEKEISRALETSDSMIAILNPHSYSSSRVRRELEYALFNEKFKNRLLPALTGGETSESFARLPWILTKMDYVTLSKRQSPRHDAQKVVDAFLALLRRSGEAQ